MTKKVLTVILIIISVIINIAVNRVSVQPLKDGESLLLSVDNKLPDGEYELEYYVVCSGTAPALSFTLKDVREDGNEIIFDQRDYTTARGFGRSRFTVDASSRVTAEFTALEQSGESVWAGVGSIRVKSLNGSYVGEALFTPTAFGKQATPLTLAAYAETVQNIQLSDFAILTGYTLNGKDLTLDYLCTGETAIPYELGLKISCGNINALLPAGETCRFYRISPDPGTWQPGQSYSQTVTLNLAPGDYALEAALMPFSADTWSSTKYHQLMGRTKFSLGVINISE